MASTENAQFAISNGIPPPDFDLPFPQGPADVTANALKYIEGCKNERSKFLFQCLTKHLHQFAQETKLTTDEWMTAINFLTSVGQKCTPLRQEFILLSDVLGLSALVDAINNPTHAGATESSVLGPFFTEDAPDLENGDSIASEGKGNYLWVQGKVLDTDGKAVPNAIIDTWEGDANGLYDTQYLDRTHPDLRGRIHADKDGNYSFRAIVPVNYPIPGDGPVGDMLVHLNRHNMRPNHLHLMVSAPGYRKVTTAVYPEGDKYLRSDAVFGVKKSLVVNLTEVTDATEAKKKGFTKSDTFKQLDFNFVLVKD